MALSSVGHPFEIFYIGGNANVLSRDDLILKHSLLDIDRPFGVQLRYQVDIERVKLNVRTNLDHFHAIRHLPHEHFLRCDPFDIKTNALSLCHLLSGEVVSSDGCAKCIYCELHDSKDLQDVRFQDFQNLRDACPQLVKALEDENARFSDEMMKQWSMKLQEFYDARVNPCALKPAK